MAHAELHHADNSKRKSNEALAELQAESVVMLFLHTEAAHENR